MDFCCVFSAFGAEFTALPVEFPAFVLVRCSRMGSVTKVDTKLFALDWKLNPKASDVESWRLGWEKAVHSKSQVYWDSQHQCCSKSWRTGAGCRHKARHCAYHGGRTAGIAVVCVGFPFRQHVPDTLEPLPGKASFLPQCQGEGRVE